MFAQLAAYDDDGDAGDHQPEDEHVLRHLRRERQLRDPSVHAGRRADGADARLAAEERSIRRSLQRVLPTVAAMQLAPTAESAVNLRAIANELETDVSRSGRSSAVDSRDTADARTVAGGEIRSATVMAFLAAREPEKALIEAYFTGWDRGKVDVRVTANRGRDIAAACGQLANIEKKTLPLVHELPSDLPA